MIKFNPKATSLIVKLTLIYTTRLILAQEAINEKLDSTDMNMLYEVMEQFGDRKLIEYPDTLASDTLASDTLFLGIWYVLHDTTTNTALSIEDLFNNGPDSGDVSVLSDSAGLYLNRGPDWVVDYAQFFLPECPFLIRVGNPDAVIDTTKLDSYEKRKHRFAQKRFEQNVNQILKTYGKKP